eukprot:g875.t1
MVFAGQQVLRILQVKAYVGTGEALRRVYSKMPSAQRPPKPPVWAYGGNWQFMPWMLYNLFSAKFQPLDFEKSYLTVRGLKDTRRRDKTKDESETNPRCMEDEDLHCARRAGLFLSATGRGQRLPRGGHRAPGPRTAFEEPSLEPLRRFGPTGRVDLSGGSRWKPARKHVAFPVACVAQDDSEQILLAVQETLPKAALFWIGFSSGSKLPIEGQGKFDRRRAQGDETAPSFKAMACICPGYNLETCFLGFKKSKFLLENETILRSFNAEAFEQAYNAPDAWTPHSEDLQELLSHVAPFAGYDSAKSYFEHENPVLFAPHVRTPCLIINALDDPLTVPTNAFGKMPGEEDGPSFAEMVEASDCGLLLMTPSGRAPFLGKLMWQKWRTSVAAVQPWSTAMDRRDFSKVLDDNLVHFRRPGSPPGPIPKVAREASKGRNSVTFRQRPKVRPFVDSRCDTSLNSDTSLGIPVLPGQGPISAAPYLRSRLQGLSNEEQKAIRRRLRLRLGAISSTKLVSGRAGE